MIPESTRAGMVGTTLFRFKNEPADTLVGGVAELQITSVKS